MATERDIQAIQHITELEQSIYQIQETIEWRTESETKFKESIKQIQDKIDSIKSEQELLKSQMLDTTSSKKKEWLKECIENLQNSITHLEEGLKGRQNNLSDIETTFAQLEKDFVIKKNTLANLKKQHAS